MQSYKTHKEVRAVARVFGLKPKAFAVFLGISLMVVFVFMNKPSFVLLLVCMGVIVACYLGAIQFQDAQSGTGVSLPKKLKNR